MKFRIHGIFLSLFFTLALGFSFSIEASAHDYPRSDGQHTYTHPAGVEDISAEDVENAAAADKEEYTKNFLLHAATHLNLIWIDPGLDEDLKQEKSREMVIFARDAREPGVFNHGDTYIIGITPRGAITNHGKYQHLYGSRYVDIIDDTTTGPVKALLADNVPNLTDNNNANPICVADYDQNGGIACAIKQETPAGAIATVAGYHHPESDLREPECDDFTLVYTAERVEKATGEMKKDLLKKYVKEVIKTTKQLITNTGTELVLVDGISPTDPEYNQQFAARIYEKALCFRKKPDLRYDSIYSFIMDPARGVAFLSGNDFTRNGLSVSLNDPNPVLYDGTNTEPNVLTAIHRTLTGISPSDGDPDPNNLGIEDGYSGFFRYHWAHPINTELNTPDYLDRCVVPGRALKESYIEVVDISEGRGVHFVIGSGIYLEDDMIPDESMENLCPVTATDDGDDGCAIAAANNSPQSTLLNLFLIASVLFSAVFLRKRA
jgi:hypothetical protein